MKRSELKSLVKECLVEILSEQFISTTVKRAVNETVSQIAVQKKQLTEDKQRQPVRQAITDSTNAQAMRQKLRSIIAPDTIPVAANYSSNQAAVAQAPDDETDTERIRKFNETLARIKSGASNQQRIQQPAKEQIAESANPLASIFQDTAETTLQQQKVMQPGELAPDDPGIDISSFVNPNWKTIAGIK